MSVDVFALLLRGFIFLLCPSFVPFGILTLRVAAPQKKMLLAVTTKAYQKCDTVFQRMGGGGKKKWRERGIVEGTGEEVVGFP